MPVVDRARVVSALPGYAIGEELGAGTSGLVLRGRHLDLDREVAVKVLAATSTGLAAGIDFRVEARLLSRLDHPHIVRIYDYVGQGDLCLLVMELLAGGTLKERRLAPVGVLAVGLAVADALTRAHESGVLHRDVKPDNILFTASGQPKITDFGIAKILDGTAGTTSQIVGTPRYMAPEQITGSPLGPATDIYALAVVLYEQLTGGSLFDPALTIPELFRHHCEVPPRPPVGVPEPVAGLLLRCLAKTPADRPASAREFALGLSSVAANSYGRHWASRSGVLLHVPDQLRDPTAPYVPPAKPLPRPLPDLATTADLLRPDGYDAPSPDAPSAPETAPAVPAARTSSHAPPHAPASGRTWRRRPVPLVAGALALTAALVAGVVLTVQNRSSAGPSEQVAAVDSPATSHPPRPVQFNGAADVAIDEAGNMYLADDTNHRVLMRDPQGVLTIVAGTGEQGWSGDNGRADEATLNTPTTVALDGTGNLYITDVGSQRIRRVDADDGIITTIAGGGYDDPLGHGDGGPATETSLSLDSESGMAADAEGNLYVCEGTGVRRIDPDGIIHTLPDYSRFLTVDGEPADPDDYISATRLATDPAGNLYITYASANQIWRVDPNKVASRFAGTGKADFGGDGGPATEASLHFDYNGGDLAVDSDGNVYVADNLNHRIRRIGTDDVITTFAGMGASGSADDDVPATQSRLYSPSSVETDGAGNVYIGEIGNQSIRMVNAAEIITTVVE